MRVAGETPDRISEELGGRYSRTDPADETVAQQAQSGSLVLAFVLGELEGDGERGRLRLCPAYPRGDRAAARRHEAPP